jgi:hypothetical protein
VRGHGRLRPLGQGRDTNADIANGADDLGAATEYILKTRSVGGR